MHTVVLCLCALYVKTSGTGMILQSTDGLCTPSGVFKSKPRQTSLAAVGAAVVGAALDATGLGGALLSRPQSPDLSVPP